MDSEFTGSKVTIEDKTHEFDSYQDKYRKSSKCAKLFTMTQVGITTFHWSPQKKKYIGRPFNIVIYPRSIVDKDCDDRCFHANADTIQFLVRHEFDFNTVF